MGSTHDKYRKILATYINYQSQKKTARICGCSRWLVHTIYNRKNEIAREVNHEFAADPEAFLQLHDPEGYAPTDTRSIFDD